MRRPLMLVTIPAKPILVAKSSGQCGVHNLATASQLVRDLAFQYFPRATIRLFEMRSWSGRSYSCAMDQNNGSPPGFSEAGCDRSRRHPFAKTQSDLRPGIISTASRMVPLTYPRLFRRCESDWEIFNRPNRGYSPPCISFDLGASREL